LITPNQIVAWNLKMQREAHNWTQEEAARKLEPFLGVRWSKATFSNAERTTGERIKKFDADEIWGLARAFKTGVWRFFIPPEQLRGRRVGVNTERGRAEMLNFSDAYDVARPASLPAAKSSSERMQEATETARLVVALAAVMLKHRPDLLPESVEAPLSIRENLDIQKVIEELYPASPAREVQNRLGKGRRPPRRKAKKNAL